MSRKSPNELRKRQVREEYRKQRGQEYFQPELWDTDDYDYDLGAYQLEDDDE